jgi:hypothetical protein
LVAIFLLGFTDYCYRSVDFFEIDLGNAIRKLPSAPLSYKHDPRIDRTHSTPSEATSGKSRASQRALLDCSFQRCSEFVTFEFVDDANVEKMLKQGRRANFHRGRHLEKVVTIEVVARQQVPH